MSIYVYIYIYIYMSIYVCIYIYVYIYMYIYLYMYIYIDHSCCYDMVLVIGTGPNQYSNFCKLFTMPRALRDSFRCASRQTQRAVRFKVGLAVSMGYQPAEWHVLLIRRGQSRGLNKKQIKTLMHIKPVPICAIFLQPMFAQPVCLTISKLFKTCQDMSSSFLVKLLDLLK